MKKCVMINIILIFILILLLPSPALCAVDESLKTAAGEKMISNGLTLFITDIADSFYNQTFYVEGEKVEGMEGLVLTFATFNPDPFEFVIVQSLKYKYALLLLFLVLVGFLVGSIQSNVNMIVGDVFSYNSTAEYQLQKFKLFIIYTVCIFILPEMFIYLSTMMCSYLTLHLMIDVLEYINPSISTVVMYFCFSIIYAFMMFFYALRVLYCFGIFPVFAGIITWGLTQKPFKKMCLILWKLYLSLLFMQVLVVAISSLCVAFINFFVKPLYFPGLETSLYLALLVILLLIGVYSSGGWILFMGKEVKIIKQVGKMVAM